MSQVQSKKTQPICYVAFLRGINVGGHKMIAKDTLVAAFTSLGFKDVRTYIQSGNVLFLSPETDRQKLVTKIEGALLESTGHEVTTMLRTQAEIQALVKSDPFGDKKTEPDARVSVAFLSAEPGSEAKQKLLARQTERDITEIHATEVVHLIFKQPGERVTASLDFVEKDLAVRATVRNWNTVTKIAAM